MGRERECLSISEEGLGWRERDHSCTNEVAKNAMFQSVQPLGCLQDSLKTVSITSTKALGS